MHIGHGIAAMTPIHLWLMVFWIESLSSLKACWDAQGQHVAHCESSTLPPSKKEKHFRKNY